MKSKKHKNFTLVEILIVVGIIALVTSLALPTYLNHMKNARVSAVQAQTTVLYQAVTSFSMDMKRLPDVNIGLAELLENTSNSAKWKGPYLEVYELPLDPWDNDYIYVVESNGRFEILSYGADGQLGGEGENADISNRGIKKQ
ncbi:type II secretion system major pseudopilin GspG [Lentisphaerota bacterium WC36G]|nr:type II secretion system major pseudopilin GspG [Lentisphaerae bacterium WC36]